MKFSKAKREKTAKEELGAHKIEKAKQKRGFSMRFRFLCYPAFLPLLFVLFLAFTSCESNDDFLSWNKGEVVFVGEYEEDGCVFRARFTLNGREEILVEMLSPDSVTGISYKKSGERITADCGGTTLSLSSAPAAITHALLFLPENPLREGVVREGAVKTETLRASEGIYKIRYSAKGIPEEILLLSDGDQKSLYIVSFSSDGGNASQEP